MAFDFSHQSPTRRDSAAEVFAITPSDTITFNPPALALSWGVDGTVAIECANGDTISFAAGHLAPLVVQPIQVRRVLAATTADKILGYR